MQALWRQLKPHPKNPRKDVGDVTELAESIKANGIFQPLTVLSGDCIDGYTVVIGHRRLAAAKLAGLKKVPCNVAEMTEQEQISTMLLENMQRNDLTVYEQAQGFQMMLDMGDRLLKRRFHCGRTRGHALKSIPYYTAVCRFAVMHCAVY